MSLKQTIREIAREEANKAFRDIIALSQEKKCITMGVITAIDPDNNRATVITEDGTTVIAPMTGSHPKGVGIVVQLVGQIIL